MIQLNINFSTRKAGKKLAIPFYSMEINSAINYFLSCKT